MAVLKYKSPTTGQYEPLFSVSVSQEYVDQLITVSTEAPVEGTDIPARDNLLWIQVPAEEPPA